MTQSAFTPLSSAVAYTPTRRPSRAFRSRSSSSLSSRWDAPSTASSEYRRPRIDNGDHNDPTETETHQLPPDKPKLDSPGRDDWQQVSARGNGTEGRERGGPLGEEFDAEVERQRAEELAAEWGRKRGSGRITKTHEKVIGTAVSTSGTV